MSRDDDLDDAIGAWLAAAEDDPRLLPGDFAAQLAEPLRSAFLRELEQLADLDRLTTGASPRALPVRFGDFRVLGELGHGAMGAVYAAEQVSLGRRVALKVMHPHIAGDLRSAARFEREARTAASLVHPGIVPVHGFGRHEDVTWLAMGLVEGRSLQRLLTAVHDPRDVDHARAASFLGDWRRIACVLADAADALEFAHRKNVVHRDVKPANLMLGDDDRIVVLDFGLATARAADAPTLTHTGDFLGTPLYMAPEQVLGARNGTSQSDVFALGAVLYECLCHRPPVTPGALPHVLDAIRHEHPADPRRVRRGVPADLAHIALQCLEKSPTRRYTTAAGLADDLRRYVDGSPVQARGTPWWRRAARLVQRRPLVAAAAVAALVLAPVAVFAWFRGEQAAALQAAADLDRARTLIATSPEGITVFGGASLRFWRQFGLAGAEPTAAAPAASANGQAALDLVDAVVAHRPDDVRALRLGARVRIDLGHEPAATAAALAALLAHPEANAADRAMASVVAQQRGEATTEPPLAEAEPLAAECAFWRGLWHQHRQDYFAAIAAFDRALRAPDLDAELRYFAWLHRGWCCTCPEVGRLRQAEDDLLQAAALRPAYGTAKLLWAALRCLDPEDDLQRPVAAVTEVLTSVQMEPWVVVLTARVLLQLAAAGTWQAGPVRFLSEMSPIAAMPLPPGRSAALAGTALGLVDAVLQAHPQVYEARWQRCVALALLGHHGEALAECDRLPQPASGPPTSTALLRARIQLAAGRTSLAQSALERITAADPDCAAAFALRADVAARLGDLDCELQALDRAGHLLDRGPRHVSVLPDAAVLGPELRLRRWQRLLAAGRLDALQAELPRIDDGSVLGGASGPRARLGGLAFAGEASRRGVRWQAADLAAAAAVPADAALHLRQHGERADTGAPPGSPALGAALQRSWLSTQALLRHEPGVTPALLDLALARFATADDAIAADDDGAASRALLQHAVRAAAGDGPWSPSRVLATFARGEAPTDAATLPLDVVLPHLAQMPASQAAAERLAAAAALCLAADPDHGEARHVHAAALLFAGRAADAAAHLERDLDRHAGDLRARAVLAAAATAAGRIATAERAVAGTTLHAPGALAFARRQARSPFLPATAAAQTGR
jgi:tetratricopeptide (TPR) repeat protein/tRNA A-37 threonylcarbamoyl transferase component Bud32